MSELTTPKDTAGSYSHFWPENIPKSKIRHIFFLFVHVTKTYPDELCPYDLFWNWWQLKKLIFEGNAVHVKCWFAEEKPLCLFFSDNSFIQSMKHYSILCKTLIPRHLSFKLFMCFLTKKKKTTQLKLPGKLDYTKPGLLLWLEELFAHLNVEHTKCLSASAGKHYRA